jgi:hypothetical protein
MELHKAPQLPLKTIIITLVLLVVLFFYSLRNGKSPRLLVRPLSCVTNLSTAVEHLSIAVSDTDRHEHFDSKYLMDIVERSKNNNSL